MAEHNKVGMEGEELAVAWLKQNGFEILERNWRHSYYEIDVVARKEGRLHFIEVKARTASRFGNPEDSVGKRKFKRLQRAVDQYLFLHPCKWIQYDILAITLRHGAEPLFLLLEDVYLI